MDVRVYQSWDFVNKVGVKKNKVVRICIKNGEGGGRGFHVWERIYTRAGFMSMYGKANTVKINKLIKKKAIIIAGCEISARQEDSSSQADLGIHLAVSLSTSVVLCCYIFLTRC